LLRDLVLSSVKNCSLSLPELGVIPDIGAGSTEIVGAGGGGVLGLILGTLVGEGILTETFGFLGGEGGGVFTSPKKLSSLSSST
jgi:hypothetical protein